MSDTSDTRSNKLTPYGSAKDLPTYQELSQQLKVFKLLTVFNRTQRQKIIDIEQQKERLVNVVDAFYERLGSSKLDFSWAFRSRQD